MTEAEAVSRFIHAGDYIGTELYGTVRCPMSLVNEIVRQGIGGLRVAGQGVFELDMLLAAGLVKALDVTYIGLEVYGISNCLRREVESGRVEQCVEWSNAAIAWRFKAAAMGVPFIPVRSMLGTDTLKYSAAKVVKCPFTGDLLCLLSALILDVGLIHVHRADKYGIKKWVQASQVPETTQRYLEQYIYNPRNHQEYLQMIGDDHLQELRRMTGGKSNGSEQA